MEREENFSLQEFTFACWHRKWILICAFLLILIIGLVVITRIPVVYRSTGVILVEQQQIPTQWVNSTVSSIADERIRTIGQRVLSTANLEAITDKFNLFPDLRDTYSKDELIQLVGEGFSVESVQAEIRDRFSGGRNSGTVAIQISYEYISPEIARDVAAELVSLYLKENLKARTDAAKSTRVFLQTEADRLEKELTGIETRISEFKEQNIGTLPEHQDINIQTYERVEQQLGEIDRRLGSLEERKIILETSMGSARRLLSAGSEESIDPLQERLEELKSQYVNLQTRYSAYHPDLIRLRREIGLLENQISSGVSLGALEERMKLLMSELQGLKNKYSDEHPDIIRLEREIALLKDSQSGIGDSTAGLGSGLVPASSATAGSSSNQSESLPADTALIGLRSDLQSAIAEQRSLRARRSELLNKLAELEIKINKTPEVEREYRSLIRDHESIQVKYNDIRSKQNTARVAESLETEQKAERFTLIEEPRVPNFPHSPDYKKVSLLAVGIAILGGLGAVFGLEIVDSRVRNLRTLESLTGVPVLATIGKIENRKDQARKRRKTYALLLILGAILGLGVYVAYFFRISPGELLPGNIWHVIRDWMITSELTQDLSKLTQDLMNTVRDWVSNIKLSRL